MDKEKEISYKINKLTFKPSALIKSLLNVIGPACPTGSEELRSDPAEPITGRTQQFDQCSNGRGRPASAGSGP
ncbi:hypothetical protein PCANC_09494 [Puccinia coronata f. sp. avenae]|uniref:Uncharacterized protein n=1 Tax=Puccinia coronata f. sp. avenae TaxID=200324 RepID=A0A2N5VVM2_9BASI|nr:hypothetical protein PCASD_08951 [Puccinia coronata f. sp. avenae]PLW54048.1 hypothetical protein PCANC_09494 [Puccinia coronata f. sp. avenae]